MKTITEMAREVGMGVELGLAPVFNRYVHLERFAALVREQYREELLDVGMEPLKMLSELQSGTMDVYTAEQLAAAVLRAKEVK